MKLLKVSVPSGYKMLTKNFEIDFLAKARVDKDNPDNELLELEDDFYYPVETVFIGKNSSGKTTTLSLIQNVYAFMRSGRIYNNFIDNENQFELSVVYYHDGVIYDYYGKFKKDTKANDEFLIIEEESLKWAKMKQSLKKDLSNATFFAAPTFSPNIGGDTSNIIKFQSRNDFNLSIDVLGYSTSFFDLYYSILKEKTFRSLLRLFDDSIDYIQQVQGNRQLCNRLFIANHC